jgi:hypothetical protein
LFHRDSTLVEDCSGPRSWLSPAVTPLKASQNQIFYTFKGDVRPEAPPPPATTSFCNLISSELAPTFASQPPENLPYCDNLAYPQGKFFAMPSLSLPRSAHFRLPPAILQGDFITAHPRVPPLQEPSPTTDADPFFTREPPQEPPIIGLKQAEQSQKQNDFSISKKKRITAGSAEMDQLESTKDTKPSPIPQTHLEYPITGHRLVEQSEKRRIVKEIANQSSNINNN